MPRGRPKGQHGGYRKPADPAPVSGPGAASQRTDGGPSDRQPVRPIPAESHGDRQRSVALQQGAPMAAGGVPVSSAAQAAGPGMALPDPFGPTRRPGEPLTAGAEIGPGRTPGAGDSTLDLLRGIYEAYPYPGVRDLLEELEMRR